MAFRKNFFILFSLLLHSCGFHSLYKNSFLKNKQTEVFIELDKNYDRILKHEIEDRIAKNKESSIPDVIIIANNEITEAPVGFDQSGVLISNSILLETQFFVFEVNKDLYNQNDYFFDGKKEFGRSSFQGFSKRDTESFSKNSKLDSMIEAEKEKRFLYLKNKLTNKHKLLCTGKESFKEIYINNFNNMSGTYQQSIILRNNMAKQNAQNVLIHILQKCKD